MINTEEKLNLRRLLLCKQLYKHALNHSYQKGAINKMIAVHNFHNSIEILLKAIVLKYEIRGEKQLNIEFEVLLTEIDKFEGLKSKNLKLSYRQDIRNLNQSRNLVQHHAYEPEDSTMELWRVITKKFCTKTFNDYFDFDFEKFSSIDMISDSNLKKLLKMSWKCFEENDFKRSLHYSRVAFDFALDSISNILSLKTYSPIIDDLNIQNEETQKAVSYLQNEILNSKYFASVLSTGTSFIELLKFENWTPRILFGESTYIIHFASNTETAPGYEITKESTNWVFDFTIEQIINWQLYGIDPKVPARYEKLVTKIEE